MAQRHNAYDHMINALMNGFNMAPFIVADGLKSENFRIVKTKGILSEIEVSGAIAQADAMIVVSHCKGHELSGFGGAIKNLGMGCTPTRWKTTPAPNRRLRNRHHPNAVAAANAKKPAHYISQT